MMVLLCVGIPVNYVLLFYISLEELYRVSVGRSELTGIIIQRNRIARDLQRTDALPGFSLSDFSCKQCFQRSTCLLYSKVSLGLLMAVGLGAG